MVCTYGKVRTSFPIDIGTNHLTWKEVPTFLSHSIELKHILQYILFAFVLIMQPYVTDGTLVYVLLSKKLNRVLV